MTGLNIDLSFHRFKAIGIQKLKEILIKFSSKSLNLGDNDLSNKDIEELSEILPILELTHLNLSNTSLNTKNYDILKKLFVSLTNSKIKYLNLSNNLISVEIIKELTEILPISKIIHLNLDNNYLDNESLKELIGILRISKVKNINLLLSSSQHIKILSELLPKSNLTHLTISITNLQYSDSKEIIQLLSIPLTIHLNLSFNIDIKEFIPELLKHKISLILNNANLNKSIAEFKSAFGDNKSSIIYLELPLNEELYKFVKQSKILYCFHYKENNKLHICNMNNLCKNFEIAKYINEEWLKLLLTNSDIFIKIFTHIGIDMLLYFGINQKINNLPTDAMNIIFNYLLPQEFLSKEQNKQSKVNNNKVELQNKLKISSSTENKIYYESTLYKKIEYIKNQVKNSTQQKNKVNNECILWKKNNSSETNYYNFTCLFSSINYISSGLFNYSKERNKK